MIAGVITGMTQSSPVIPDARSSECPNVAIDFPLQEPVTHFAITKAEQQVATKDKANIVGWN